MQTAIAGLATLLAVTPAGAHRLDEYLQAIRVDVGVERVAVEIDLTPGASLAADVLSTLDANGDGAIAADEERSYVAGFLENLEMSIDGQRRFPSLVSAHFPSRGDLLEGVGVIRLVLTADAVADSGAHRLVLRNQYRRDVGVYLANALRPSAEEVTIAAQVRDPKQQSLEIEYVLGPWMLTLESASWALLASVVLAVSAWRRRTGKPGR